MTRLMKVAGIAGLAIAISLAASTSLLATQDERTVRENQAMVVQLGANATAISYWTSAPDGWHVVTTVDTVIGRDSDSEQHAIVRFSAILMPGQAQLISVPAALGEASQVLRIRRQDDRIEMDWIADSSI